MPTAVPGLLSLATCALLFSAIQQPSLVSAANARAHTAAESVAVLTQDLASRGEEAPRSPSEPVASLGADAEETDADDLDAWLRAGVLRDPGVTQILPTLSRCDRLHVRLEDRRSSRPPNA